MKKTSRFSPFLLIIIGTVFVGISLYAGAVIIDFRGEPGPSKVTLYWSTLSEVNCKGFQIERGLSKTDFDKVDFLKGAGNSSTRRNYEFIDKTVYKPETTRTFYYRLKIINIDESESNYSEIVAVTPAISGARYTWGSIKAIFR
jgi:hypothetical protein